MQRVGDFEYLPGPPLGHGAFALVYRGRRIKDNLPVAVKEIKLKNVPGQFSNIRQKEIAILKDLRHPNIVQLYDYLETGTEVYLVMEFCNGGDMGDYLAAKKTLSEDSIRILARHIAGALEVLTANQIIHRDIKPQNLLLSYPTGNGGTKKEKSFRDVIVKLADFGFARHLAGTDMAATLCGSPLYMAPEILLGRRYDNKADLWSVGTILFQCLHGKAPFMAENPHALRKKYSRDRLIPKVPSGTSQHLSHLLTALLKKDPAERLNYAGFFAHPFLRDVSPDSSPLLSQHVKSSPVPIKRHTQQQQRHSPQRGSVDKYSLSPSSASGPPVSHQIGSQSSVLYLSAQSPRSDIIDQGFILVDIPGSSRRPPSRSHSLSISPSSTPSNPSTNHTPSSLGHTPSSLGSLRYNSLNTPFYITQGGTTPTNIDTSSGYHSRSHLGSASSLSRSNSGRHKPAHLPFGQLITHPSHSPHHHSLTSTPSPHSTPPTTQQSNQIRGGIRYAHPSHGSGSRLSSLVEVKERKNLERQNSQPKRKDGLNAFAITHSCLLVSDEEVGNFPTGDGDSPTDEFPLDMSFTSMDEQGPAHETTEHAQSTITVTDMDAVTFAVGEGRPRSGTQRSAKLSQDLAAIRTKADSLDSSANLAEEESQSNSPKIGSFQLPFLFGPVIEGAPSQGPSASRGEMCMCLKGLMDSLVIGRELTDMAKARQGPILLLSTSTNLNDAGVGSRSQRYSEQLVLYAKAVSVLEESLLVYGIDMASGNTETSQQHRQVESEVRQLLKVCLDKARAVKKQLSEANSRVSQVSAEKLLYLEALDMCKAAVLDEKSGEAKECIKRYRRAKVIFEHLLSIAKSSRDKLLLQKYVTTSQHRVELLSTPVSY